MIDDSILTDCLRQQVQSGLLVGGADALLPLCEVRLLGLEPIPRAGHSQPGVTAGSRGNHLRQLEQYGLALVLPDTRRDWIRES